mgnify:CR=1 FL=1
MGGGGSHSYLLFAFYFFHCLKWFSAIIFTFQITKLLVITSLASSSIGNNSLLSSFQIICCVIMLHNLPYLTLLAPSLSCPLSLFDCIDLSKMPLNSCAYLNYFHFLLVNIHHPYEYPSNWDGRALQGSDSEMEAKNDEKLIFLHPLWRYMDPNFDKQNQYVRILTKTNKAWKKRDEGRDRFFFFQKKRDRYLHSLCVNHCRNNIFYKVKN